MSTKKKKTVVLCGGHLSPALSVIERMKLSHPRWEIVYFGRVHALEHDQSMSLEYRTITSLGIPFYAICAGRLQRHTSLGNIRSMIQIPIGMVQSMWHLNSLKADAIVGFGGYLSAAVCFSGWLLRVPILIHEQTVVFGLANRLISRIASTVCISFSDTDRIPASVHPILTGYPLRKSFEYAESFESFGDTTLPLLYITGGSLGSHGMNILIKDALSGLVGRFRVLHQCGEANDKEDFQMLTYLKGQLPPTSASNYQVVTFVDPLSVGSIMREAAVIVSRAGANTVYEIAAAGSPAVLIPLPWSADGEQQQNARRLADSGLAVTVDQNGATSDILLRTIEDVYVHRKQYRLGSERARKLFPMHGADTIVKHINALMENE